MRSVVKILQTAALLTVVTLLASAGSWAQSQESESLGDIARKQKEKKAQQEQKESKTLTNEDLPKTGGISSGGSASGTASSADTAGTSSDAAASPEGEKQAAAPGQEESSASAQEKLDEARKELESLQHDVGSYERGIPRMEEKAANEHDESLRQLYANAAGRARQNLEDTRKKAAEAEKKVAELEAAAKAAQQNQPQPEAQPQPQTPPESPQ